MPENLGEISFFPHAARFDAQTLGIPDASLVAARRHDGPSAGVDMVELRRDRTSVSVLPTRGMGLWKATLGDLELGWKSPVRGPVHPALVPISEPGGLGWLDGFDELLCRCGLYSNGAPEFDARGILVHPLHGRIANTPAHRVEAVADAATGTFGIIGTIDECRFHFQKLRLRSSVLLGPDDGTIRIVDEVTNIGGAAGGMELLYHINLGEPLLTPGSTIHIAAKQIVPRNDHAAADVRTWNIVAPHSPKPEQVYFFEPLPDAAGNARALLVDASGRRAFSVEFPVAQLPCFSLWKNPAPSADGYVVGLEPGINFPNVRSFEEQQGRVKPLQPGETARFELTLRACDDPTEIANQVASIAALQAKSPAKIHAAPLAAWCS